MNKAQRKTVAILGFIMALLFLVYFGMGDNNLYNDPFGKGFPFVVAIVLLIVFGFFILSGGKREPK
jgi:4-hydroxybenzoate polyprenyltransferase